MKTLFLIPLVASAMLLSGCEHALLYPDTTPPIPPRGLATATGDNFIELYWDKNPESDIAGYNVFVGSNYTGKYELIGSTHDTYFMDNGAKNGSTYYYAVTAYDYEGNESDLSKDVAYDVPRPEGYNVQLSDYRLYPGVAGYDFSTYSVVPYNDQYADMFFENYNGTLYMNVGTDSDIQDVGPTKSILDISTAPVSGWSTTHDAIMRPGHTYVVWTWDDHYAKFRVSTLSSGRVVFDWAYQLQEKNPMLKRAVTAQGTPRMPIAVKSIR